MASRFHWSEPATWAPAIRHAQSDEFWIWALLLLAAGLACGYGFFYFIRRARIIEDTPTSRIRSAAQGYVELTGMIRYFVGQPVVAPLTQQACAWYHFVIERKETTTHRGSSSTRWNTVEEQNCDRPFECSDATGVCVIDPRGAEIHTLHKDVWYGGTRWPSHGPDRKRSWFSSSDYRYTEYRLHESDPLYALGEFRTVNPDKSDGKLSDEVKHVLRTWKADWDKLLAQFDSNGDGQIDLQEWEQVRQAAEKQVTEQRLERAPRPALNIMTKTDDFRRPYILSTQPQTKLATRFRLRAVACTLGFILCVPLSNWMIFIRLSG